MKIKVKDYLKIKEFECEFEPGFTSIIGTNSSGKSSLLLAIESLFLNPRGSQSDINFDSNRFEITLTFGEYEVSLKRNKTEATYHIKGTKEPYRKIGGKSLFDLVEDLPFFRDSNGVFQIQTEEKKLFPYGESNTTLFDLFENVLGFFSSKKIIGDIETDIKNNIVDTNTIKQIIKSYDNKLSILDKALIEKDKILNNLDNVTNFDTKHTDLLLDINTFQDVESIKEIKRETFDLEYPTDYYTLCSTIESIQDSVKKKEVLTKEKEDLDSRLKEYKQCPLCGNLLEENK